MAEAIAREEEKEQLQLPRLEPEIFEKLQDDLLNGIHVTYHDKGEEPRRLHDISHPCDNFSAVKILSHWCDMVYEVWYFLLP